MLETSTTRMRGMRPGMMKTKGVCDRVFEDLIAGVS
jgi:hypothetical protein